MKTCRAIKRLIRRKGWRWVALNHTEKLQILMLENMKKKSEREEHLTLIERLDKKYYGHKLPQN